MFKSTPATTKLQNQSSKILDVFNKTISDLEKINKEASETSLAKVDEATALLAEAKELEAIAERNTKVMNNIKKIFE